MPRRGIMEVSVKSDKKRSDRERIDREKLSAEKPDTEKPDTEKPDTERSDTERSDAEKPDMEKSGAEDGARVPEGEGSVRADAAAETGGRHKKARKDSTAPAGARKHDDQEEEGEDWENDDLQDDWEEESEPSKPWVIALVFFGMIFAAAAICVMLWVFTHSHKPEGENQNAIAGAATAPGSGDDLSQSQKAPSGAGSLPLDNQDGEAGSGPGETGTPAPEQNRVTTKEGRIVIFTDCDDMVTPKEYVNLRTEPSTSQGEATVGCRLNYGEVAHRTGISEEMGWSRVEYNDQVLYVITSFVNVVTNDQPAE